MKKTELICLGIILSFILTGCGGGSGGGNPAITGTPVWNAGIGVIIMSTTASFPSLATEGGITASLKDSPALAGGMGFKQWLATQSYHSFAPVAKSLNGNSAITASAISETDWDQSVKYIFLDWQPLSGASYYQVYFLGADGSLNRNVWDSRDNHPNDPAYATKAFLDITEELAGIVKEAGQYQFKVIAYNSSSSKEYPVITVSIGRLMGSFPTVSTADTGSNKLSWAEVDGAEGYKAGIYKDVTLTTVVWDSGEDLLEDTFTTFDPIAGGDYYAVAFAYADENGRPAEITGAISGFTIK